MMKTEDEIREDLKKAEGYLAYALKYKRYEIAVVQASRIKALKWVLE